jgi:hypothetical protein
MSYPMASVIRLTLIGLYLALVAPLPWLAPPESQAGVWVAVGLGLGLIVALTSEQVELDDSGIRVGHPPWCRWLLRRGWALDWSSISALTPVATSQGGRVFYLRGPDGSAFLLPQRVANFDDFLLRFGTASGIDTSGVGRISPPWTYQLLAGFSATLLLAELAFGLGIAARGL